MVVVRDQGVQSQHGAQHMTSETQKYYTMPCISMRTIDLSGGMNGFEVHYKGYELQMQ